MSVKDLHDIEDAIASSGFAVVRDGLPEADIDSLVCAVDALDRTSRAGIRHLLERVPEVRGLPCHPRVRQVVSALLGPDAFAARATLFDKTPQANWNVTWHQDVTIAVAERAEVEEYGPWSEKDGVMHVQPPVSILENMLAIRIHLDDCGPDNGPLRVLPGSHRYGRLDRSAIEDWQNRVVPEACLVPRGGLVAMRPLLLHASSAARSASHRRVIHLEFAAAELQPPLTWFDRWPIQDTAARPVAMQR